MITKLMLDIFFIRWMNDDTITISGYHKLCDFIQFIWQSVACGHTHTSPL